MKKSGIVILIVLLACFSISFGQNKRRSTKPKRPIDFSNIAEPIPGVKKLTPRDIARIAFPSTVSIYALTDSDDIYTGVGFIVAPGVVVTCYHVVEDAKTVGVTPINKFSDKHFAQLLSYDQERDIALLQVKTMKGSPLKLFSGSDLYVGSEVYTLGNPKGLEGTFSNGIISNFRREDDTFYLQFTAPVSQGSSGGPVFDEKGEVIGMVNMQYKGGQNLNFAIMSLHIQRLMEGKSDIPPDTYLDDNLNPPSKSKP